MKDYYTILHTNPKFPINFCLRRPGGTLFVKPAPVKHLDPVKHPQKLLIKVAMLCNLKESMQTMTAFGSF
jgi:hypothetical protein